MNPPLLQSAPSSLSPAAAPFEGPGAATSESQDLGVAEEMIASLHTLTPAGSRYMMSKIVTVLRGQVAGRRSVGSQNQRTLKDLVARLEDQAEPSWPDVFGFSAGARHLLRLLVAVS